MSLLAGFVVSLAVFLLFSLAAFSLGFFWWHIWRLPAKTFFLIPLFGLAILILWLNFILHLTSGFLAVGLAFSLVLLPLFYFAKARTKIKFIHESKSNFKQQPATLLSVFLVMLVTYLLLVVPLLLINGWVITGYNVNNDSVFHNIMSEHFYEEGYKLANTNDGKNQALREKLFIQGYPDSFHHLLGLVYKVTGIRSYYLFNFTEAFFLSLLASVVLAAVFIVIPFSLRAIFISIIAATSYLQVTYSLQGFAPQIAVTPFLFAGIVLIYLLVTNQEESSRMWPSLSLVFAAGLGIFSFSAFFWWGLYALILLSWLVAKKESFSRVTSFLILAVVFAFLLNPFAAKNIPKTVAMANTFSSALGNLLSPKVPLLPVFSSWLAADHRLVPGAALFFLSLVGVFLGLLGLLRAALKIRHPFLNLTLISFLITLVILKFKAGPYYFAKSLQPFSVFAVTLALLGFFKLVPDVSQQTSPGVRYQSKTSVGWQRLLSALALMVYISLILFSNVIALRAASPAPKDAFSELELINKRYGLKSSWLLFLAAHEDWGRYILSNFKVVSPQALAHRGLTVGRWSNSLATDQADFDAFKIDFSRFKYLVIAKTQDRSLVSPLYQQVYAGKYFHVYVRKYSPFFLQRHLPLEIKSLSSLNSAYLLKPGQEILLAVKPTKFAALLARQSSGLGPNIKQLNNLLGKPNLLVSLGKKKQLVPVSASFKLFQLMSPVAFHTLSLKNIGPQVIELDWLELLKKPYPKKLLANYNRYLNQRRFVVDGL